MLFEMAHRRQPLAVGQKKIRNDQIETRAPAMMRSPSNKRVDAHPFDFPVESLSSRARSICFGRTLFGSDEKNRVFTHRLYTSLTFTTDCIYRRKFRCTSHNKTSRKPGATVLTKYPVSNQTYGSNSRSYRDNMSSATGTSGDNRSAPVLGTLLMPPSSRGRALPPGCTMRAGHFCNRAAERRLGGKFEAIPRQLLERPIVARYDAKHGHFEHLLDAFHPEILRGAQIPVQDDPDPALVEAAVGKRLQYGPRLIERQHVRRGHDNELVDVLQ